MKKVIILNILVISFLVILSVSQIHAQDKITMLKEQISSLEKQKTEYENEKQSLIDKSEEISYKIDEQKRQSESGLGIFGRFALSQNLKKAQNLSNRIQEIDKKIHELNSQIKEKESLLIKEYESQINILLQQANRTNNIDEKKVLLEKIKDYRVSANQLRRSEQQSLNTIDVTKIEIQEYDSPKEIREKADLISDIAKKTNSRISFLDSRIIKIKDELKLQMKSNESANEISIFGDKVVRNELTTRSSKESVSTDNKGNTETDTGTSTRYVTNPQTLDGVKPSIPELPQITTKSVIKNDNISANVFQKPQSQLEEELKNLEKQRQELKKQLLTLNEKSNSFRKKADELDKTGDNQATKANKQNTKDNSQGTKDKKDKP